MCGISGLLDKRTGATGNEREIVDRMVAAQHHRGPDDNGTWFDDRCVLGHNRLTIIDLTSHGTSHP